MRIWKWLIALFRSKAGTNSPPYPEPRGKVADERAREAMRVTGSRLPPVA